MDLKKIGASKEIKTKRKRKLKFGIKQKLLLLSSCGNNIIKNKKSKKNHGHYSYN